MKATGIVRRIDDLGRVVIPKEIRRTLRIREGDPLEIFTDREGEIILKKYSYIDEMEERLKEASGLDKGFLEYLLALQYDNKGDEKKSAMYLEASKKDMITSVEEASKAAADAKEKKKN